VLSCMSYTIQSTQRSPAQNTHACRCALVPDPGFMQPFEVLPRAFSFLPLSLSGLQCMHIFFFRICGMSGAVVHTLQPKQTSPRYPPPPQYFTS
jgi:hypothetical protein